MEHTALSGRGRRRRNRVDFNLERCAGLISPPPRRGGGVLGGRSYIHGFRYAAPVVTCRRPCGAVSLRSVPSMSAATTQFTPSPPR